MIVIKSLSNNMVLVLDEYGNECICQGKGIGWGKKRGDTINSDLIERRFRPENEAESTHFQQLFSEIPDEFWEIAEEVVEYGKIHYGVKVSQRVILPLCDHMAGSMERYKKGVCLENPMLWDIKRFYPKEFKIGQYALECLKKRFDIEMQEDEAAFLAYHFITAQLGDENKVSIDTMTKLTGSIIDLVQQSFQIILDEEDWNYQRFLTHLKFFVNRIATRQAYEEPENSELYMELKKKYPHVNRCVERISDYILIHFHYDIGQEERLYLLIHIERVTRRCHNKN